MAIISIAKALRVKNNLIQELNQIKKLIQSSNQQQVVNVDTTANWEYDMEELMESYKAIKNKLILLKVALDNASLKIRASIYSLSELKSEIKLLESIPTNHGLTTDYRGNSSFIKIQWPKPAINLDIKDLQSQINELQDSISEYNNTTMLEIVDFEI